MEKEKENKVEREYTIPLREKVRSVPRYKKTNKAIKSVKEFLARHMKIENRDLNKIKLDLSVNEAIWARGIKNPVHKIKIKAIKEDGVVRVSLVDIPKKIVARRNKIEKREKVETKKSVQKEAIKEKVENQKDKDKDGVEDKVEVKESEKANEESKEKEQETMAKEKKKTTTQQKTKAKSQPKEKIAK